jgi:hypothetical protein
VNYFSDAQKCRTVNKSELWNNFKMDEKAIDGWFQFDCFLDLARWTVTQYIVIG